MPLLYDSIGILWVTNPQKLLTLSISICMPHPFFGAKDVCYIETKVA